MSKHIKGPWTLDTHGPPTVWAKTAKGDMKICDVRGWGHLIGQGAMALPEHEAVEIQDSNGRLLSAAPDMYEALKYIHEHIADPERGPRDLYSAFGLDSTRVIEMASAALAKAEGRL